MQEYTRLATPRFRRFTIRFIGIEIEFRSRSQVAHGLPTPGERALRRAHVEEAISRHRDDALLHMVLHG